VVIQGISPKQGLITEAPNIKKHKNFIVLTVIRVIIGRKSQAEIFKYFFTKRNF